jgi:hypothetical protein
MHVMPRVRLLQTVACALQFRHPDTKVQVSNKKIKCSDLHSCSKAAHNTRKISKSNLPDYIKEIQ